MSGLVVIDKEELRGLIADAVRDALAGREEGELSEWLDSHGAAQLLGVHPRSVAAMVRRQGLPCRRIGDRLIRYNRRELEAWIEAHKK